MSAAFARAVVLRPLYLPSPFALRMPSRWRSTNSGQRAPAPRQCLSPARRERCFSPRSPGSLAGRLGSSSHRSALVFAPLGLAFAPLAFCLNRPALQRTCPSRRAATRQAAKSSTRVDAADKCHPLPKPFSSQILAYEHDARLKSKTRQRAVNWRPNLTPGDSIPIALI